MSEHIIDRPLSPAPGEVSGLLRRGVSRRGFLGRGMAGIAAAGTMAITTLPALGCFLAEDAPDLPATTNEASAADAEAGTSLDSVVAHVRDIRNGLIDLHVNGTTINLHDPQLAQNIARAAR